MCTIVGWLQKGFEGPWTSKNIDFVKYILQKSLFHAIRIRDLVKTPSATLLSRVEAPMKPKRGSHGGVNEQWVALKTL